MGLASSPRSCLGRFVEGQRQLGPQLPGHHLADHDDPSTLLEVGDDRQVAAGLEERAQQRGANEVGGHGCTWRLVTASTASPGLNAA